MRLRIYALAAALGAGAAVAAALWPRPHGPERIVLLVVDTLRRDHLSCYGSSNPTPHIDALAARGQLFRAATASFHQTSMSMTSLFTGRTPSIESTDPSQPLVWNGSTWCGLARFAEPGDECIPASVPTLAEALSEAGYETLGIASNYFLFEPSGFSRGFDDWTEVGVRPAGDVDLDAARASRAWPHVHRAALAALERRHSDRFFLYVHYMDVHDYPHRFGALGRSVAATRASYAESVAAVDEAIGRLLGRLEEENLLEGAVVLLTADHGERLGERHAGNGGRHFGHFGNPSYQEMLRVPLIVAPPLGRDAGRMVRTQDLFDLIRGIAGLSGNGDHPVDSDELFVSELKYRTYRQGRWKTALAREDGSAVLFDLVDDPSEKRDAAGAHSEVVAAHRRRIDELSRRFARARGGPATLSPQDEQRLRGLGYIE